MQIHEPVMVSEVMAHLAPQRGGIFIDCTVGLGGHAAAMLAAGATRLIGFDRDPAALRIAAERLQQFGDRVTLVHSDFRAIEDVLAARGEHGVDGVLADLGVSSMQLDGAGRGFSFRRDEALDMRMDPSRGATAADVLAVIDETSLADVIFEFGEERFSRRIARAIVAARESTPIATTGQLANIVRRAVPHKGYQRIDPATRTFQALRIYVNGELDGLDRFVEQAAVRLAPGGRLAVLTFHSLEDRIVKHTLRALERVDAVAVLTKKPLVPGDEEVTRNPRARSAKLRVAARPEAWGPGPGA